MKAALLSLVGSLLVAPSLSFAQVVDEGDWIIRAGVHDIDPRSNNSDVVNVDAETQVTFDFTYMLTANWGLEVLAGLCGIYGHRQGWVAQET